MFILRHSKAEDLDSIMEIIVNAISFLKSQGIDQWQKGSPNRELLLSDIQKGSGYVLTDGADILATCAIMFDEEPSYQNLFDGNWKTDRSVSYATVHRFAVHPGFRGRGTSSILFTEIEKIARKNSMKSIRIDTHEENVVMQKALTNAGFCRCGNILLSDGAEKGSPRIAYEKVL